jgi:hypothetical protein
MKIRGIITIIIMLFYCFNVNATEINREISKDIEVKTQEKVQELVDEIYAQVKKDLEKRIELSMIEILES